MTLDELGEGLLLLAVRGNGMLAVRDKLRFGMAGSELIRLAAARRVDIVNRRIVVLDASPTGDALLDQALASMTGGRLKPTAKSWVARQRKGLVEGYLDKLEAAGAVRAERRKALGFVPVTRWTVTDTARLAAARTSLDIIASGTGSIGVEQAALAGLADAIGLTGLIYPGFAGASARRQVRNAARRDRSADAVASAVRDAGTDSADAAIRAATNAAADAAIRAATDAAVAASIDAATQAAISAATEAAHHAAHDAGGAGGAVGGHH
jgi:Golgi phosphoprotein 3 (GPP34)